MQVERRTVVRGAAWTVPAVVLTTQAPAFAASPCAPVAFPWTTATTGAFRANSGIQTYSTGYAGDGINRFVSESDNNSAQSETLAANAATITQQVTLNLPAGRPYTFTFSVASRFSSDSVATSQNQYLQVQTVVAGTATDQLRLVKGQNPSTHLGGLGTWTSLAAGSGVKVETFSFTFTPPAGVSSFGLRYLYTLPARGRSGNPSAWTGQSDIGINAPTIVGC